MRQTRNIVICIILLGVVFACNENKTKQKEMQTQSNVTAKDILGNPDYLAISYGGYRKKSRDSQPTILQLKEDMKLLSAMGIKLIRTYNVQPKLPHASNILKAITELKQEDENFEMYVMLGAWIDCLNAWTDKVPNHDVESPNNAGEIERAVALANQYPDIVKIIAVGNEAMVKWATSYYVQPDVILKWVNHLQSLKIEGKLNKDLWITSSDDFASWGGGEDKYHVKELEDLIKAVDFISMHTYPYHNTHYNPEFWRVPSAHKGMPDSTKIEMAMERALKFSQKQYDSVTNYMKSLGVDKPIHIGETGWATTSGGHYGDNGSRATDEYKQGLFHQQMREWTNRAGISCFYFEAFNEQWKDAKNPKGSENHFGLFTIDGKAKYPIWDLVDKGVFDGLTRDGNPITKTYNGNKADLMEDVLVPPTKEEVMVSH
ncbi:glycosyl hydrolase family 17 protein [Winogradskyella jejuensis]|uniref:Endo-1,3-beta-glucanase btgC n=1 Tax=Winogradskyella jejuensis TaxID=1089305 RepID=A0A1M5LLA9_9FLAO|nr:glycosyl hydrolase family 17 protein [Winogradskyella jejuensis]SHG65924.1 Exo-beta-1,3-glucanase, GH17 family [Winogradskyella jejuensis]